MICPLVQFPARFKEDLLFFCREILIPRPPDLVKDLIDSLLNICDLVTFWGRRFFTFSLVDIVHFCLDRVVTVFRPRGKHAVPPPGDSPEQIVTRDPLHVIEKVNIAGKGPAKVRKVRHICRLAQGKQTKQDKNNDEVLHLHRDKKIEIDVTIGEHHAERNHDPVHRARRSNHHRGSVHNRSQKQLGDACNDAAREIENEKLLRTPDVLDLHPKHPQTEEHVEKQMHDSAMHELIRDQLPGKETVPQREERKILMNDQAERISVQLERAKEIHQHEYHRVRYHQPFDDGRKERESAEHRRPIEVSLVVVIGHLRFEIYDFRLPI